MSKELTIDRICELAKAAPAEQMPLHKAWELVRDARTQGYAEGAAQVERLRKEVRDWKSGLPSCRGLLQISDDVSIYTGIENLTKENARLQDAYVAATSLLSFLKGKHPEIETTGWTCPYMAALDEACKAAAKEQT